MVSRRNFYTILTLLLIMIFMFMFSGVIKQELNEYGTNSYAEVEADEKALKEESNALSEKLAVKNGVRADATAYTAELETGDWEKRVLFVTRDPSNEVSKVVTSWCNYMKRPMIRSTTLTDLDLDQISRLPEVILLDGEAMEWTQETDAALRLAHGGACVIFARMPSAEEMRNNQRLREMMGIKTVSREDQHVDGYRLFPGFLLGTEEEYVEGPGKEGCQDLDLMIPWYVTGEGSKTYVMGVVKDGSKESEELPSIVWRHAFGYGKVFCIGGDFMTKETGIGFLTACLGEKDSYDVYPVINAQNLVLANYGGVSNENAETLNRLYDQKQIPLFRDVVWPSIISMTERSGNKLSLMVSPQMDYSDDVEPEEGLLIYYLKLLNEGYGEAGLSTKQFSSVSIREKLGKDRVYWEKEAGEYSLRSLYLHDFTKYDEAKQYVPDLRTIVTDATDGEPVFYVDDNVTCQETTNLLMTHRFSEDIKMKAFETALGFSNVVMDMSLVSHPQGDEDYASFSRQTASNFLTYWKPYAGFDKTTLSESDLRIRRFFALDYSDHKQDNEISLHVDGFDGQAFFILKLNQGEIDEVTGAEVTNLKNGFFLLDVSQEDVKIKVRERRLFYY